MRTLSMARFLHRCSCEVTFKTGNVQQLTTQGSETLAKQIGGQVTTLMDAADSIADGQNEILIFGLALPIAMGFTYILLLRLFAGIIVYLSIIAIGIAPLLVSLYCFVAAGMTAAYI